MKLWKLTLKAYIGPFIATFFICVFVLLMQFLWKYVDEMVGKGLEWYIIAELLFYASASMIPLALPLAVLLSSMMTMGSIAENQELMAFKSAGVSLLRIMRPLIIIISLLSIAAFFFSNTVIPKANLKFGSLLWDVRQSKPALDIKEGIFYDQIEGYSIQVGTKRDNNHIEDVLIYDHTDRKTSQVVIRAERGKMFTTQNEKWLIFELYNGQKYEEMEAKRKPNRNFPHSRMKFDEYTMRFDLSGFQLDRTEESLFKHHYQMLNINQLEGFIDSFNTELKEKQDKMGQYLRNHFHYLQDSAFFEGSMVQDTSITSKNNLINAFKPENQQTILRKAEKKARATRDILSIHESQVDNYKGDINDYSIAWHKKFTLSFACLILFFIGAPMGAIIRKGGLGMPTVVSVLMFLVFHVTSIVGEKLVESYFLPPWAGVWLPVMILFPTGIFITIFANSDSMVLTKETYVHFFKQFTKFFKRTRKDEVADSV